jgi:nucleoside-diphosphate-sugar epimerase
MAAIDTRDTCKPKVDDIMKILVTGGLGSIGGATVRRLLGHGHTVRVIDRAPEPTPIIEGAEYAQCDILDYEALRAQVKGCEAIIHLAALRSPGLGTGPAVFESNVMGAFNVFEAAAAEGIKRIAHASSINALGAAYSLVDLPLHYFPIDEAHPSFTTDPYSFAKQTLEAIGEYYWRREGIVSAAFRFPWVYPAGYLQDMFYQNRLSMGRQLFDDLLAQPAEVRAARLAKARERALAHRQTRPLEYRPDAPPVSPMTNRLQERDPEEQLFYAWGFDRFNFWTFVDDRDAAQGLHKALTADYQGAHAFFLNDSHNWLNYDSEALLTLFYPDVTARTKPIRGAETLVSIDKARDLLGFEVEYSVHALVTG